MTLTSTCMQGLDKCRIIRGMSSIVNAGDKKHQWNFMKTGLMAFSASKTPRLNFSIPTPLETPPSGKTNRGLSVALFSICSYLSFINCTASSRCASSLPRGMKMQSKEFANELTRGVSFSPQADAKLGSKYLYIIKASTQETWLQTIVDTYSVL